MKIIRKNLIEKIKEILLMAKEHHHKSDYKNYSDHDTDYSDDSKLYHENNDIYSDTESHNRKISNDTDSDYESDHSYDFLKRRCNNWNNEESDKILGYSWWMWLFFGFFIFPFAMWNLFINSEYTSNSFVSSYRTHGYNYNRDLCRSCKRRFRKRSRSCSGSREKDKSTNTETVSAPSEDYTH